MDQVYMPRNRIFFEYAKSAFKSPADLRRCAISLMQVVFCLLNHTVKIIPRYHSSMMDYIILSVLFTQFWTCVIFYVAIEKKMGKEGSFRNGLKT